MFPQGSNKVNGKQVGVMVTPGQRQAGGDPNEKYAPASRITHAMECSMVLVRYGDKDGMARQACLLRVGTGKDARYFMPPNAELWTKDLKPVAPWLAEELAKHTVDNGAPIEIPENEVSINPMQGV